jgi:hypothetical protein
MNLTDNPLHLLKASIRDNKSTLVDLSEDYSLLNDDELGNKYFNELTSPRRRLSIEVAWLLGVGDVLISDFIENINDIKFTFNVVNLNPLSKANLLASSIEKQSKIDKELVIKLVIELSQASDGIHSDEVQALINQERNHSRFLTVESLEDIDSEIEVRSKYYKDTLINLIDTLPSIELVEVITRVSELDTDNGHKHCSNLVKELIIYYELKAQQFLVDEESNVDTVLAIIDSDLNDGVSNQILSIHIDELIRIVRNWDLIAQPIQILFMSQGLTHEKSSNLAHKVRELNLRLFNEHNQVELTKKLTNELKEIFAEDVEVKERAEKDLSDIDGILEDRLLAEESDKKFAEEITYQVEIGIAFKDKFLINPEVIEWKGRVMNLSDITKLRWGAISNNTGTEYRITYGSKERTEEIVTRKKLVFSDIVDRLWKTAGINLLFQYMAILRNDENVSIGGTVINDHGVLLERSHLFSSNEQQFLSWGEVEIYSSNGNLVISKIGDGKMNSVLSYLDVNNVHILESMIRMKFKTSGERLSDAFMDN